MTPAEFLAWRKRLGLTVAAAAETLGRSPSRIADYEAGVTRGRGTPAPIPRAVALACGWIEYAVATERSAAVLNAPVRAHLLATCLARRGGPHVVVTLGAFKALSDDERCELCAETLRQHADFLRRHEEGNR